MSTALAAASLPLAIPGVWRGERQRQTVPTEASGIAALDLALLGGWPQGALTQLVSGDEGLGLSVIVPTLARLTQAGRPVALIQTPHQPCAPALVTQGVVLTQLLWVQPASPQQALWAFEQLLRSGLYAAVAYWGAAMDGTTERRLQLAAEAGKGLAFCFRVGGETAHSYAATRLALRAEGQGGSALGIEVLKCRGLRAGQRLRHGGYSPLENFPSACRQSRAVVPAQAGIQLFAKDMARKLDPRLRGNDEPEELVADSSICMGANAARTTPGQACLTGLSP